MKFLRSIAWADVFAGWEEREANNPNWVHTATEVKGWPDWKSWRLATAHQLQLETREWELHEFTDPENEIPEMLLGPFTGWQSRVEHKNRTTFAELLKIPKEYEHFHAHSGVLPILNGLPFSTEFIGLIRKDTGEIVCIDGHHRATAIALAKKDGTPTNYNNVSLRIALATLPEKEHHLLDLALEKGTEKQ